MCAVSGGFIFSYTYSILPTKNPILTSLQCINQVIFRMIDFSIIDFESQVLFHECIYWMLLTQSNNRYRVVMSPCRAGSSHSSALLGLARDLFHFSSKLKIGQKRAEIHFYRKLVLKMTK